jgi:polyhydroxybutyrate depolymerase
MSAAFEPPEAGDGWRTLDVDGRRRSYLAHVPSSYDASAPTPLVLAFHGGGSSPEQMVGFCGLNNKANREGFIVVYPKGTGRTERFSSFNAGNCCGHAAKYGVDDVKFTAAMLDDLQRVLNIDPRRVFATGMSNGGMMAYRLASELSDRVAAVAPVAGTLALDECRPARPVSVLHFHGTRDQYVPLEGGKGPRSLSRVHFHSVQYALDCWIRAGGCPLEPEVTELPDAQGEGMPVTRKIWSPGDDGCEVILYLIAGGGHTWPGRAPTLPMLGRSTLNISANDLMWDFFRRHPMP